MVETVRHTGSEMGHLDPSERPTVITFMRGLLESRRIAAGDGNGWGNVDGSSCCTSCMNRTIPGGVASSSPVSRTSVLGWGLTRTIQYRRTGHNSPQLALELLIVQRTTVGCPFACSSNSGTLSGGRMLIHDFWDLCRSEWTTQCRALSVWATLRFSPNASLHR